MKKTNKIEFVDGKDVIEISEGTIKYEDEENPVPAVILTIGCRPFDDQYGEAFFFDLEDFETFIEACQSILETIKAG